ncbi:aldo/keto reductase [Streptomyces ziwulingensis]
MCALRASSRPSGHRSACPFDLLAGAGFRLVERWGRSVPPTRNFQAFQAAQVDDACDKAGRNAIVNQHQPPTEYTPHVNIRRAVDASLKRLRTDRIDLYQFHHIDRATGFDEIWQAADTLADPAKRAQIQAYEDLLDRHGVEPGEAATAWLLTRPGVTGPIVGPRTAEQPASALRAVELELPDEPLGGLDGIFPGPGPSPKAFAW